MSRLSYTTVLILSLGTEAEHRVRVTGQYSPGCPAWGGSRRDRPTNPPEEPTFEVETIEIEQADGTWSPWPETGGAWWLLTKEQLDELRAEGIREAGYQADEALERRAELRRHA